MTKIRKNDTVQVIKGKDRGKKGKVIQVFHDTRRLLVEGVNTVKKHKRQTRQDQAGGIVSIELPLRVENVMLFCKQCNRPVRTGVAVLKDQSKARVCRRCKETL